MARKLPPILRSSKRTPARKAKAQRTAAAPKKRKATRKPRKEASGSPKPVSAATPSRPRAVSRSLRRRLPSEFSQLLKSATAAEAELLSVLASRATGPITGVPDLQALCTDDSETKRLDSLIARIRDKDVAAGQEHRERARALASQHSAAAREIGPLPEVADPDRKAACRYNFKLFLETYGRKDTFYFDWSPDQLNAIARIERTVLSGGLFAMAMPRGNGKSSLCEWAVIWSIVYGHHNFVMLICATDEKFHDEARPAIRAIFETNELLASDFPEVCHPITELEGIAQRSKGQMLDGERTNMTWSERGKRLILPTVADSQASGCIIGGGGLTAATLRGSRYRPRDGGRVRRPSLLIFDDPQTADSAASVEQSAKRVRLVTQDGLGVAGPDGKLSVLVPCTVINRGDMADQLLDREKHPEFKGERTALILSWPTRLDLWDQYSDIRRKALKTDDDLESEEADPAPEATQFVRDNHDAMHAGGVVSWEARKRAFHVSALQQAMDFYFRDPVGFFAEYQNWLMTPGSPADPTTSEDLNLEPRAIESRLSGYRRGVLPPETQLVTAYIDCHQRVLFWMVCAWTMDFTGSIVDYGTFPKTSRANFTTSSYSPTLQQRYVGTGEDGALTAGLKELTAELLGRNFTRTDGVGMQIALCPIDTGYKATTIRRFVEPSPLRSRLLCSMGRAIGADDVPMHQYKQRAGERLGDGWLIRKPLKAAFKAQHVLIDTYEWKTFAARRLLAAPGDPGAVVIFGEPDKRIRHEMLAQHLAAERPIAEEGRNTVTAWHNPPGQQNHWWDSFVGNCVAASVLGAKLGGTEKVVRPVRAAKTKLNLQAPDGRSFFVTR